MPKYRVELTDGRKFEVEADAPPSEQDVLAALGAPKTPEPTAATPQAPTAIEMLGMMGRGPAAVKRDDSTLIGRLRSAAEPMTQPWLQESTIGKIAGLTGGMLMTSLPDIAGYYASAAKQGAALSGKLRDIPKNVTKVLWNRATDPRTLQEVQQSNFNDLPLYAQMEHLPTHSSSPIAGTLRTADPPPMPSGPHLDLSQPVRPGGLSQQQIADRIRAVNQAGGLPETTQVATRAAGRITTPIEPMAAHVPTKSPQQLLNEEALARRRSASQAQQPQTQTDPARAFVERYDLPTPTAADTRFPKGMRGKSQPPIDSGAVLLPALVVEELRRRLAQRSSQ